MKPWVRVMVAVAMATPLMWTSRVEADGEPIAGFGTNGVVIDSGLSTGGGITVGDVVGLPDGSIVVSGFSATTVPGGPSTVFTAKYLPSGQRDPSFGANGIVPMFFQALAPLPNGGIVGSQNVGGVAILSPNGQVTAQVPGTVNDLVPRPDGSVIAIGKFSTFPTSRTSEAVAKVISPTGVVDTTFDSDVESLFPRFIGPSIIGAAANAFEGTLTRDGRLIVNLLRPNGTGGFKGCTLVAFNPAGGIDTSFGTGGFVDRPELQCRIDRFLDDDSIRVFPTNAAPPTEYSSDGFFLQQLGPPFDDPRLVMEGTGFSYAPDGTSSVTSFDPLGSVDPAFGVNGTATLPGVDISGIKLLDSGNVIAWGSPIGDHTALALGLIHASFGTALQPPAVDTTKFVPVPPTRILDTREGIRAPQAKLGTGGQIDLQIAGVAGVPDTDISAVVLNVTATNATQAGFVSVYPSGTRRPIVSNLNLETAGQTAANLVTVKVGDNGRVTLFSSGGTDLVADVAGYYTTAFTSTDGRLQTAAPERILDTRAGLGAPLAKLPAGGQIDLQVTGRGPVPAEGVEAVVLNVTGDQASLDGFVTAWPTGTERPVVSNLNLVTGETRPNLVVVPVGVGGQVSLFTSGGTDLIADVAGWFTDSTAADDSVGLFVPITPTRVLDTRQESTAPTAAVSTLTRLIGSTSVVPPDSTIAVAANITVTQSGGPGFVTAWPANTPRPLVSNLNSTHVGQTIPNAAIVPLGNDQLSLFVQSGAHLIVDINGWYTAG